MGLCVWKSHPYFSSTLRVHSGRDDHLTRCLQTCSNLTSIETAEDPQSHDFTDASFIRPEAKLVNGGFDAITSHQEDRIHKRLPFESSRLSNTKTAVVTGERVFGNECSLQQPDSQKKEKRRKSRAERAIKHKEHKNFKNERLKHKGDSSYDWRTPYELLVRCSPARYTDPPSVKGNHLLKHPKLLQLRADQIPRPLAWSKQAFWYYVDNLTRSLVDPLIERQLYGRGGSHVAEVSRILTEIFQAPAAREFLSPEAFNVAISFFYTHTALPQAIALFEYMQWLRMEIPGETMDIMLRGCAIYKDLYRFTKILEYCTDRGIVPTAGSWTMLLRAVRSRDAQEVIIESMKERKMLEDTRTVREVVRLIVREDLIRHLDNNLDPTSFLDSMDTRFGTEWLSESAGNIILYELGQRKPAAEAVDMLHTMMKRGMETDEVTLNTLLKFCSWEKNHLLAIRVLRLLHVEKGVRADRITFNYLFMQAWSSRLYNFARVIWRTACVRGVATFKIKNLVKNSLLYYESPVSNDEPGSRARIWMESAGEVIVGIKPVDDLDDIFSSNHVTKTTTSGTKKRLKLIDDDFATAGRYRLVDDLPELLIYALKLDRMWMECGAWKGESSRWKRKLAIAVQVTEMTTPRITRYH